MEPEKKRAAARKAQSAAPAEKTEYRTLIRIGWIAAVLLLAFLLWKLAAGPGIWGPFAEEELSGRKRERAVPAASREPEGSDPEVEGSLPAGQAEGETSRPAGQNGEAAPEGGVLHLFSAPILSAAEGMTRTACFTLDPPPASERTPSASVTVLALGDNLMHNTVMWSAQTGYGYDFRPIYRYIRDEVQAADIACIDQETIFINDPNEFTNYPSFGGPVQIGEALIDTGFDVILHATNHCYDKYSAGIRDTLNFWHQHPEITVLGIHDSQEDADTIRVVERNGIRIAMLNYTYGTNAGGVEHSWMIDYLDDEEKIADDIARAKEISDFVLVFPHWGSENTFEPDDYQKKWAQFFADHGVGAVIGGHTHTLQPVETLTGADGNEMPVYWSLGNFVSDMASNWNMLGGMALLTVSRDQ